MNYLLEENVNNTFRDSLIDNQFIEINHLNISDGYFEEIFKANANRNIKVFNYISYDINNKTIIPLSNNKMVLNKYIMDNISIYLFSISLSLKSTNFPIKGSIIPIMKDLIMINKMFNYYDADTPLSQMNIEANSKILHELGESFIYNPENNNHGIDKIGFHNIYFNNNFKKIAINISENENTTTYLQNNEILSYLPKNSSISENIDEVNKYLSQIIVGYDLWRIFLYAIIILILLEMWLVNIYFKYD